MCLLLSGEAMNRFGIGPACSPRRGRPLYYRARPLRWRYRSSWNSARPGAALPACPRAYHAHRRDAGARRAGCQVNYDALRSKSVISSPVWLRHSMAPTTIVSRDLPITMKAGCDRGQANRRSAWPLAARAQQGDRVWRIGVLMSGDENDPVFKTFVSAFIQALADLGWTDGRGVRMGKISSTRRFRVRRGFAPR